MTSWEGELRDNAGCGRCLHEGGALIWPSRLCKGPHSVAGWQSRLLGYRMERDRRCVRLFMALEAHACSVCLAFSFSLWPVPQCAQSSGGVLTRSIPSLPNPLPLEPLSPHAQALPA